MNTPQDKHDKLVNQIHNNNTLQLAKDIDEISNALDGHKTKIPEVEFKTYFFPFISGQLSIEEANKRRNYWIHLANGPMREVDVIDIDDKVLFTVPPLFNSNIINSGNNKVILSLFAEYGTLLEQSGIAAENMLKAASSPIVDLLVNDVVFNTYKKQWIYIFNRYSGNKINTSNNTSTNEHEWEMEPDED